VTGRSELVHGVELFGVCLEHPDVHPDQRGSFAEVYSADRPRGLESRQWSVVASAAGSLRGMHLHLRHDECVSVITGEMAVGLYDVRPDSPTRGRSALYVLTEADLAVLTFPRGLVHGWVAHGPTKHLQGVSETYANYKADDNAGCRWDDPALDLPWPVTPTIVSERARSFGSLAELERGSDTSVLVLTGQ